jgi:hypothetical protein
MYKVTNKKSLFLFLTRVINAVLFIISFTNASTVDNYSVRFEFPFGIGNAATTVTRGSNVKSFISVESFVHENRNIEVTIKYPPELKPLNNLQYCNFGQNTLKLPFSLRTQNDIWYYLIEFEIDSHAKPGEYNITCIIDSFKDTKEIHKMLYIADKDYAVNNIHIKKVTVPCDKEGRAIDNQRENTFVVKDPSSRFFRSFFVSESDHGGENIGVDIENSGDFPVLLNFNYNICNTSDSSTVNWLDNLREESGLNEKGIHHHIFIEPHSVTKSILTIKSRSEKLISGNYLQFFSASLFTSKDPIFSISKPLQIIELNVTNVSATIFAFLISISGILLLILYRKVLWKGLTSKEYILIALYSAIAFSTVSIPTTVVSNFFHALLGPFSFLITGIFSEVISYMLLVSLVVLLPRPGVITCFLLVKFLLSSVVLGNLSIISFLWYPMRAVILELAFYFTGIFNMQSYNSSSENKLSILYSAFIISCADALLSFVSLNMTMFFYRLYYDNWYLWLYTAVSGFLYTFIAVPFGIRTGNSLKKVFID